MNEVKLRGHIRDIKQSHSIGNVDYDKANIVVQRDDGKLDVINLCFKKLSNTHKEGDYVELCGNLRSYSKQHEDGTNKVDIYVFTYFDNINDENVIDENDIVKNCVTIDGRICKKDKIRKFESGKKNTHITIANNIFSKNGQKLNSYIPCVAWGTTAEELDKLEVGTKILIQGKIQSREYIKHISEEETEIRVAHELHVVSFERTE